VEGGSSQLDFARRRVLRSLAGYERTEIFLRWSLVRKATIVFQTSWPLLMLKKKSSGQRPTHQLSLYSTSRGTRESRNGISRRVCDKLLLFLFLLIDFFHYRYNAAVSGPSGNVTVNGSLTYGAGLQTLDSNPSRDEDALSTTFTTPISEPLYAIHNGKCFSTLPLDHHLSLLFSLQRWVTCPYRRSRRMLLTTVVVRSSRCTICLDT
jgi:hypothetical protein